MTETQQAVLGAVVAAIVGFAIGAGWQYSSARGFRGELETTRTELDSTSHELALQRLEATLGAATIESHRGNHESGRRLASEFFSGLQDEVERAPAAAQPEFRAILEQRDAMITALSRGSPESAGLLSDLFVRFRTALGEDVGPIPAPASEPPTTTTSQ